MTVERKKYIMCNLAFHRGLVIKLLVYLEKDSKDRDGNITGVSKILEYGKGGGSVYANLNYTLNIEFPRDKDIDYNIDDWKQRSISLYPSKIIEFKMLLEAMDMNLSQPINSERSMFKLVKNEVTNHVGYDYNGPIQQYVKYIDVYDMKIGISPQIVSRRDDVGNQIEMPGIKLNILETDYGVDFSGLELRVFRGLLNDFNYSSLAMSLLNTYMLSTNENLMSNGRKAARNMAPKDVNESTGKPSPREQVGGSLIKRNNNDLNNWG